MCTHTAEWKEENFDRLLSHYVSYARSANAIDETRKDFDRVAWGGVTKDGPNDAPEKVNGFERLIQRWFAGNHSDVGGSYPEVESRLSDIALQWMAERAIEVPDGLKTGPIFVHGEKMPNTGNVGQSLHLYPAADGVQHSEIVGMQDTIDGYEEWLPKFLRKHLAGPKWEVKVRTITHDGPVHPTVRERFVLDHVVQCEGSGPYRPEALKSHDDFKGYYPPPASSPTRATSMNPSS
jgi:Uncharacterized alpha/beta hydrolase domain (DUF2235)